MNARLAATLALLCGHALAGPAGSPPTPAPARETAQPARAVEPAPPPPPPPAPSERALMLAGIALMAGIALRRMGDGAP